MASASLSVLPVIPLSETGTLTQRWEMLVEERLKVGGKTRKQIRENKLL